MATMLTQIQRLAGAFQRLAEKTDESNRQLFAVAATFRRWAEEAVASLTPEQRERYHRIRQSNPRLGVLDAVVIVLKEMPSSPAQGDPHA